MCWKPQLCSTLCKWNTTYRKNCFQDNSKLYPFLLQELLEIHQASGLTPWSLWKTGTGPNSDWKNNEIEPWVWCGRCGHSIKSASGKNCWHMFWSCVFHFYHHQLGWHEPVTAIWLYLDDPHDQDFFGPHACGQQFSSTFSYLDDKVLQNEQHVYWPWSNNVWKKRIPWFLA